MTDAKKTQLFKEHTKLGATMAPFAGWEMPIQYSSVKAEVEAVRKNVGVFDVSHMGEFFFEGPDAIRFADYLVTNDVEGVDLQKAVYSPLCRDNGTVIDDLIVYKIQAEKVMICVNAANTEKDWNWIKSKHSSEFNCTIENRSDQYSLLALQGPQTPEILKKIGVFADDSKYPYYSATEITYENNQLILARTGYTGEDGFEIFCPNDFIVSFWNKLMKNQVVPCGLASRDVLRLEVAFPLYGNEIHDEVAPLDSALKWTVKMNKKNFVGKAALENYSPKYRLVKLSIEKGVPRIGYPVENENGEVIGKVTSGTMSPTINRGIALAHIELAKLPDNRKFVIGIRNRKFEAEFHKTAFVTGGHK